MAIDDTGGGESEQVNSGGNLTDEPVRVGEYTWDDLRREVHDGGRFDRSVTSASSRETQSATRRRGECRDTLQAPSTSISTRSTPSRKTSTRGSISNRSTITRTAVSPVTVTAKLFRLMQVSICTSTLNTRKTNGPPAAARRGTGRCRRRANGRRRPRVRRGRVFLQRRRHDHAGEPLRPRKGRPGGEEDALPRGRTVLGEQTLRVRHHLPLRQGERKEVLRRRTAPEPHRRRPDGVPHQQLGPPSSTARTT